jgi:hypothetical protein
MQIFVLMVAQKSTAPKASEVFQILSFATRNSVPVPAQARAGTEHS